VCVCFTCCMGNTWGTREIVIIPKHQLETSFGFWGGEGCVKYLSVGGVLLPTVDDGQRTSTGAKQCAARPRHPAKKCLSV